MVMIEWIKDCWLTWRTGLDRQTRDHQKWYKETVVQTAVTIENMFIHFKYIVPVTEKIFDLNEPFGWVPCEDFKQYMFPNRNHDNCVVYYYARGYRDPWDGRFHLCDLRCEQDQVFVATNNEVDAMLIALKYS